MDIRSLLLLVTGLALTQAYSMFRARLPNGDHVPHPCKPNFIWHGVGHQNAAGGGERNPFGLDFAANGYQWTEALCRKDSDEDGTTNGQELGDPNCVWSEGQTPERTDRITHPGICDPFGEGQCAGKDSWVDCTVDDSFECEYINAPEVRNITIRFPRTKVPAKETTYICFNFELPSDQEYHLIATQPIIDNENVMHHMVLSACEDTAEMVSEPQDCLMGMPGCGNDILGLWTVGVYGECFNPLAGFRVGKGGFTKLSLQHHWTNPYEVDTYYDSSGLILYYTPVLRRYDAGVMTTGQTYLNIPPGMKSVTHKGGCSSDCTSQILTGDIHITRALNHMHYLGIHQNFSIHRPGQEPIMLTDAAYSYDTPEIVHFSTPITVHPGDDLRTWCTYQSVSRAETTYYGPGSYEEMCFAIFTYFPAQNSVSGSCTQYQTYDHCGYENPRCDIDEVFSAHPKQAEFIFTTALTNCDSSGKECWAQCPGAIERLQHEIEGECFGEEWDHMVATLAPLNNPDVDTLLRALNSCRNHSPPHTTARPTTHAPTAKPNDPSVVGPNSLFMDIIKQLDSRPLLQNIIMNVNYNNGYNGNHDDHKDEHDAEMWH